MARTIIKITDPKDGQEYFLDWSTIIDGFVTVGMSLEEFKEYYIDEYGHNEFDQHFEDRMNRVNQWGTSSRFKYTPEELILGTMHTEGLTMEKVLDVFCRFKTGHDGHISEIK